MRFAFRALVLAASALAFTAGTISLATAPTAGYYTSLVMMFGGMVGVSIEMAV